MEIWIIKDGEKAGPFNDFEIRGRIENHEIPPTTPAWHEGMPEWRPLHTISLFDSAFERAQNNPFPSPSRFDEPEEKPEPPPTPAAPPPSAFPLRRFWARWFDLNLFAGVWWVLMWASGRDIGATLNSWVMVLHFVPWFVLEAVLLHRHGVTPGKWLLGLKVVNDDGTLLALPESTRRSARVLFIGIGFGWPVVSQICQLMSYVTTRRIGRPLWDQAGGHRVLADGINPIRLLAYVFILAFAAHLKMGILFPYYLEEVAKSKPEMREQLEKSLPWYSPKKQ